MQGRDIAIVVGILVLVILLLGLLGGGMMMGPGMMGWGGFGFFPWWGILMLLFWALVIGGGALLLVWLFRQGRPPEAPPVPMARRPLTSCGRGTPGARSRESSTSRCAAISRRGREDASCGPEVC